jgi:hypothetical protein
MNLPATHALPFDPGLRRFAPVALRATHAWGAPMVEALRTVTLADRPDLAGAIPAVLAARWPGFLLAGRPAHDVDLVALLHAVPRHQVLLLDGRDEVLGVALSVPLTWDRTVDGLPAGWDGAVTAAADLVGAGRTPDTVTALSITLGAAATGRGLGARMITALKVAAFDTGAQALIAPVRPVLKAQYPLATMAEYLSWRTTDDRMFDPWLRVHLRLGAVQVAIAHPSITVRGSVGEWQEWTDLPLPATGEYVIPGGLVPLLVDRAADVATYREPNVWMVHRTGI